MLNDMKELDLSYKQFCIFTAGLENPFNDWTNVQVQQGFSMRKNSVSIMTISSEGILQIEILCEDKLIEKAKRIIEFEFEVENNCVEIATIVDGFKMQIKNGIYKIRVQIWSEYEGKDVCYITFLKNNQKEGLPRYIKYDDEITKVTDFDLNGKIAN